MSAKKQQEEQQDNSFPRMVYRKGSGRKVNDQGLFEAEGKTVHDQDELSSLGSGWVNTPAEAATKESQAKADAEADKKGK